MDLEVEHMGENTWRNADAICPPPKVQGHSQGTSKLSRLYLQSLGDAKAPAIRSHPLAQMMAWPQLEEPFC